MTRKTLLAATAASTMLLGLTAAPALAAPAPEATAAAYVFTGGPQIESFLVENGQIRQPMHASGFTPAHPGWDIRLSDEAGGPGLPKQDVRLGASQDATTSAAGNRGFLTISDGHASEVPLLVLNYANSGVSCDPNNIWYSQSGQVRLWVRDLGNELYEHDWSKGPKDLFNGGGPADRPHDGLITTIAKVTSLTQPGQLTGYAPFAKYQDRTRAGGRGFELEITQDDRGTTKTYRILVGASAAAC